VYEKIDITYKAEDELSKFATLIKTPSFIHTYKIDEYSLWSAAVMELRADDIIKFLEDNTINEVPETIIAYIKDTIRDFWTLEFYVDEEIALKGNGMAILKLLSDEKINKLVVSKSEFILTFNKSDYYELRNALIAHNVFLIEVCENERFSDLRLKPETELYPYQEEAVNEFISRGRGVILMPPGAGKTLVGLRVIEHYKYCTLIFVKDEGSYKTWKEEISDRTNLQEDIVYNEINPNKKINICSYRYGVENIDNFDFNLSWGFIIYDDANNLPAKQSQNLAYIPSKHKLAMESLLSRTDNNEYLIFKTIGANVYNLTLKKLEVIYHQIKVKCIEVKVPFIPWDNFDEKDDNHTVSKSEAKVQAFVLIDKKHEYNNKVMISYFKSVSQRLGGALNISVADGDNANIRGELVNKFNNEIIDKVIFTKIIEKLPLKNIDVLTSLSYHGESERDEYIRIGKLKSSNGFGDKTGYYYALVSRETKEEEIYAGRRRFMIKHGYDFKIVNLEDLRGEIGEV